MISTLLKDLLEKVEGVFFHRTSQTPQLDGMYDPLGDAELFTPNRRGSMNKDTDGKLYYPTKGGYYRTKSTIQQLDGTPTQTTTTNDTAVGLAFGSRTTAIYVFAAYQNSGGARTLYIGNSAKTIILYSQSINSGALTQLTPYDFAWPANAYVWWDAAAGASQYVNITRSYLVPVDDLI